MPNPSLIHPVNIPEIQDAIQKDDMRNFLFLLNHYNGKLYKGHFLDLAQLSTVITTQNDEVASLFHYIAYSNAFNIFTTLTGNYGIDPLNYPHHGQTPLSIACTSTHPGLRDYANHLYQKFDLERQARVAISDRRIVHQWNTSLAGVRTNFFIKHGRHMDLGPLQPNDADFQLLAKDGIPVFDINHPVSNAAPNEPPERFSNPPKRRTRIG